jgi:hypothetical protein
MGGATNRSGTTGRQGRAGSRQVQEDDPDPFEVGPDAAAERFSVKSGR